MEEDFGALCSLPLSLVTMRISQPFSSLQCQIYAWISFLLYSWYCILYCL